jgi:hypothetical protein
MLKRGLVLGLTAALALALALTPVSAAPKKPKPYKSAEGTLAASHPNFYSASGSVTSVTAKDFENSCAVPQSNGVDALVFAVPKAYQKRLASVTAVGTAATPAGYDLDLYTYDKACKNNGYSNAEGVDEYGYLAKGTAWVLVTNYAGEPGVKVHIEIKP